MVTNSAMGQWESVIWQLSPIRDNLWLITELWRNQKMHLCDNLCLHFKFSCFLTKRVVKFCPTVLLQHLGPAKWTLQWTMNTVPITYRTIMGKAFRKHFSTSEISLEKLTYRKVFYFVHYAWAYSWCDCAARFWVHSDK